jgi:hypothetical protein
MFSEIDLGDLLVIQRVTLLLQWNRRAPIAGLMFFKFKDRSLLNFSL